ncbi:hypothetical protein, partial [Thalassospira sp. MCCC 1A01428]|uniref:hypothetical protein n=1 Tax=Thalassospira sp. MCCC 1A01428 TaxID=1470575 RepID=UPI000A2366BA
YPYMWWADTTSGHLKQRNAANTAWIDHGLMADAFLRTSSIASGGVAGLLRKDGDGSQLTGVNDDVQEAIDQIAGSGFAQGQTWQDVTASRAKNTDYTNDTAKPIMVSVSIYNASGTDNVIYFIVDGVSEIAAKDSYDNSRTNSSTVVVPVGSTYRFYVGNASTIRKWHELRGPAA